MAGYKMLYFDEATHTYLLDDRPLKSVSSIVASQFRKFNAKFMARNIAKTRSADPDSPYFGMTEDQIEQQWTESGKESRDAGTRLHLDIENFFQKGVAPENPDSVEWKQFLNFVNDHPSWVCIGNETRVHNHTVGGTIDAIFDTPEGIVLVDWKRIKALDFSGFGMGKGVMRHVPDCNYSKYSLQLSLYRRLINVEVKACYIVQMHPTLENYSKVKAQDFHMESAILLNDPMAP